MYIVYVKDYIHHLLNESKMSIFIYNSDQEMNNLYWPTKQSLL